MRARHGSLLLLTVGNLGLWAGAAQAQSAPTTDALLAATQGDPRPRQLYGKSIDASVRASLQAHAVRIRPESESGASLVGCKTPECMEALLVEAGAQFGIVPALWQRPETGSYQLTLSFIERSGRTASLEAPIDPSQPQESVDALVRAGLERRSKPLSVIDPVAEAALGSDEPAPRNAWKAGPALLIAGGIGTFIAIGVKAAQRGCTRSVGEVCIERRKLNTAGVAAASLLAAGALLGGTAWWVVGSKRRRERSGKRASLGLRSSQLQLRLDY